MASALLLLGICACGYAQLVYPDQYERMKATAIPQYAFSGNVRESRVESPIYNSVTNAQNDYAPLAISQAPYTPPAYQPPPVLPPAGLSASSMTTDWNEHVNGIISRGVQKFALDVQREIYKTTELRENIIFSPLNIAVALAMVLLGSAGRTFEEVSRVLGLETGIDISRHSEVVHQMFGLLLNRVEDNIIGSFGPRINLANGIFVQEGYGIRPEFKAVSESAYRSEVINLDFQNRPKEAQDAINSWVNEKTEHKISQILSDVPDRATRVILASALYFNGEWNQHFMRGATKKRPFFIEPNDSVNIDMMYNAGPFYFYEDKPLGVKIVRLPYKGQDTAMYVLLPSTPGAAALRDFQSRLTAETLEYLIGNMKNVTTIIGLPRMKLSSTWNLRRTLRSLGLESLFNPTTADLSLLSQGYSRPMTSPPQTTARPRDTGLTTSPTVIPRPGKSGQVSQLDGNNDLFIFPRFGEDGGLNPARRNFFAYEDKSRGLSVQQWATGFSISRTDRRTRREALNTREIPEQGSNDPVSSYTVEDPKHMKIVTLEQSKYRFESKPKERRTRKRRQSRQMNEEFLKYIKSLNLPSYGLDDLRNSANLVNPGLFATDVLHKVEIEVTETGTEAAASTAVILERDGNQKRLVANRPFVFFIRHDPTKFVLFWGAINTPTPNYPVT